MNILLIKEEDIKRDSPIGGNVDLNRIFPAIKTAQITMIKPFLGTNLYNKILIDFSTDSLTGLYKEMYEDYIKSMLIHISTAFYFTYGAYSVSNKGIYKALAEDTEGVDKSEIDYMVKAQEKYYEAYKDGLFNFLKNFESDIPEWTTKQSSKNRRNKIGGWSVSKGDFKKTVENIIRLIEWSKLEW